MPHSSDAYVSFPPLLLSFTILNTPTAPYGYFIRVDFRDQFSLEESETCEYDRLEIRDGQFGYSDLIDVICGHNFPTEISSTDRYLWLRFKSDESIEYSGFRAVYTFIPLPSKFCSLLSSDPVFKPLLPFIFFIDWPHVLGTVHWTNRLISSMSVNFARFSTSVFSALSVPTSVVHSQKARTTA